MVLTLHRRYPAGDYWEIDPNPMGKIVVEADKVRLEMEDSPIKAQIKKIIGRPIAYINSSLHDEFDSACIKIVEHTSSDYLEALVFELRRYSIEARKPYPAMV